MSEPNDAFWASARPPKRGWMARGEQATAAFNAAQAPAEPDVTAVEPTDYLMGMSMAEYAEQRSSMPVVNDFGLVKENTSGFPDAADLKLSAEQMAAMTNPYRVHDTTGYEVRQPGIPADQLPEGLGESLGGTRARGTANLDT